MKNLLIVSVFGDLLIDDNSRINSIYTYALANKKIITTDFDHGNKKYKDKLSCSNNIYYIHVPSYKKNLSIKRLYSHIYFAFRIKKYLEKLEIKPDILYCTMPTSTAAFVCGKYCKNNKIRFVIDIVDLWPDSLLPVNIIFKIFKWVFYPWKYLTIKAYKFADIIMGESKKYVEIASKYNPSVLVYPVYLGIDRQQIEKLKNESRIVLKKPDDELWICYAGSLGTSYDFDELLCAIHKIHKVCNYKLIFIGGGCKQKYIEQKIDDLDLNGIITGRLSYSDYLKYLSYCDIGINIFKRDTFVVHSYKFNDYVASNLFILNSLSGETAELIDAYKIGRNFNFSDCLLKDVLKEVCEKWDIYKNQKENNIKIIDNLLDKNIIYPRVLEKILD
jgi:glycosyltransferase involved in cell wall biosynthesis